MFFSLAVFRITLYLDTKAFKLILQICLFIAVKILFYEQKDILKEYGGVNKNMLENILSAYEHHDTELQTLKHSPYYSVDNLPKYLCIKNGNFTILSINVDGLLSKIDELSALIELLQQQNIMFVSYVYKRVI